MKRLFDKFVSAIAILGFATGALATKVNAPGDINNFGPSVIAAGTGTWQPISSMSGYVQTSRQVATGTGLTGGGDLSADRTLSLASSGVTAGTYGDATHVGAVTLDATGRATSASSVAITFPTITNITGNAGTATKLQTARTISITGDLAYTSPSFDGSGNVTAAGTLATVATAGTCGDATHVGQITINAKGLTTTCSAVSITGVPASTANTLATPRLIGTLTGDITSAGSNFDGSAANTNATTLATTIAGAHTFSGVLTASGGVIGNVTGNVSGSSGSTTGNAATATALVTSRTIDILTGDVTGSGCAFTGAANCSSTTTLATVNTTTPGSYGSTTTTPVITVNGKGLVTASSSATIAFPSTISGNAGTATALQTARTIGTATGDVTSAGSSFDGSANNTNAFALATTQAAVHTWSANQTFSSATSFFGSSTGPSQSLIINSAAGTTRQFGFQSAGSNRWAVQTTGAAESGGNAGSNFNFNRYDDTGTLLDAPLNIVRSTGVVGIANGVNVGGTGINVSAGGLTIAGGGSIAGGLTVTSGGAAITGATSSTTTITAGTNLLGTNVGLGYSNITTDAGATYTLAATGAYTQDLSAPITANRTVTLPATGVVGVGFHFVRRVASTGAFTWAIGALKSLAAGSWCDIIWTGSAYIETAFGSL